MENMFAEVEELRARCQSTPTIAERRESISSVDTEEMRVPHNGPIMVNVGVQVDTADPIFQFPSAFPGSHYGFYHSGSNRSPPETRSVPQSPYSLGRNRRSGAPRVVSWGVSSMGNGDVMRPLDQRLDGTSSRRTAHIGSSPQLNTGRTNGHFTDTQKRDNVSFCVCLPAHLPVTSCMHSFSSFLHFIAICMQNSPIINGSLLPVHFSCRRSRL